MIKKPLPIAGQKKKILGPADVVKDITFQDLKDINILFINLPLRETATPNTTPEGPLLLATNLRDNFGVNPSIIDLNAYRIKDELAESRGLPGGRHLTHAEAKDLIHKHIKYHGEPDIVAMSGMITTLRWQKIVAEMIRDFMPDVFLVSGNGLATELKLGLFNYIPELDAISHSEGDDVIRKICFDAKTIKQKGMESAINSGKLEPYHLGIINGRHRFMYAGDRPKNLDAYPSADLDLLKQDVNGEPILDWYLSTPAWGSAANNSSATPFTMNRSTTSVSSRGCPFACLYCYRGQQGERNWGVRSAEHIHKEIVEHIEKYNLDFKGFPDDNFAVAIPRIEKMVPLLSPLDMRWGTHTRMDEGADPKRIKPMADAGCVYIGFGPESADKDVLVAINKGGHTLSNGFEKIKVDGNMYEFPKSMTTAVKNCIEYGIHANCTWIMGLPTETLQRLKNSVAFIKWQEELCAKHGIPSSAINKKMFNLTWYPGTGMIKYDSVREKLNKVFGITFESSTNKISPFDPVCDDAFYKYLLELDDATKVLSNKEETLNFGDMSQKTFLQAREHVDSDDLFKILEM